MATSIKTRFTLTGTNFDPADVSRVIGLTPTQTWRRGEQRASSNLRWEHDGWMLSTTEEASLDLEIQIQNMLEVLKKHTRKISLARKQFELDAEIGCSIYIEDRQTPCIQVNSKILKAANELGADIDIDIYC